MTTIIVTLLVITILVTVHELGHALAAKLLGMQVVTFSVGFGKRIFERRLGAMPVNERYPVAPRTLVSPE